jgi:hypothetical protein
VDDVRKLSVRLSGVGLLCCLLTTGNDPMPVRVCASEFGLLWNSFFCKQVKQHTFVKSIVDVTNNQIEWLKTKTAND